MEIPNLLFKPAVMSAQCTSECPVHLVPKYHDARSAVMPHWFHINDPFASAHGLSRGYPTDDERHLFHRIILMPIIMLTRHPHTDIVTYRPLF